MSKDPFEMPKKITDEEPVVSPDNTTDDPHNAQEPFRNSLVYGSTMLYSVFTAIGALVSIYFHNNFTSIFSLNPEIMPWSKMTLVIGLGTGVLLIGGYFFEEMFASFDYLKGTVKHLLGEKKLIWGLYLALISAVGEELLFRAALLPATGLVVSSIIFGLMHLDLQNRMPSAWSLWAFLAGLLLGWVFQATGSLWPCIAIHFLVNAFSILSLQLEHRRDLKLANLLDRNSEDASK